MARKAPRPVCPMSRPSGQRDHGRDEGGEQRVLEVLGEAVGDAVGAGPLVAADQPGAEVLEEFEHVRLACLGARGCRTYWRATSSASATRASSRVRTTPTITGVGKLRWKPSVKSWPRPPSPM